MSSDVGGRLIVVSGPSGSGKSTLWRRLVEHPGVTFSVSATTRSPRPGEQDGRDYYFLGDEEFSRRIKAGEFLEHAEVHGNRYGTLISEVRAALDAGLDLVLEIDVQGAEQARASDLPVVSVFVVPPSMQVLEARLRARASETEEQIRKRLAIAEAEMIRQCEYDHVVVNDDLERMISEVEELLHLERAR